MDGMLTKVIGEVRVEDGPRPFTTTDALARQVMESAHGRAMAEQARAIAAQCRPNPAFRIPVAYDPDAAARAAERARVEQDRRRAFLGDRLRGLLDAGTISKPEYRAASEIADLVAWEASGRIVMARSQFRERMAASADTLGLMALLEEAERTRYKPWRLWASAFPVKADRTLEDLTRAVVVQRLGMRQAANAFRMDQRRVVALLRRSLGCYAILAGWAPRPKQGA